MFDLTRHTRLNRLNGTGRDAETPGVAAETTLQPLTNDELLNWESAVGAQKSGEPDGAGDDFMTIHRQLITACNQGLESALINDKWYDNQCLQVRQYTNKITETKSNSIFVSIYFNTLGAPNAEVLSLALTHNVESVEPTTAVVNNDRLPPAELAKLVVKTHVNNPTVRGKVEKVKHQALNSWMHRISERPVNDELLLARICELLVKPRLLTEAFSAKIAAANVRELTAADVNVSACESRLRSQNTDSRVALDEESLKTHFYRWILPAGFNIPRTDRANVMDIFLNNMLGVANCLLPHFWSLLTLSITPDDLTKAVSTATELTVECDSANAVTFAAQLLNMWKKVKRACVLAALVNAKREGGFSAVSLRSPLLADVDGETQQTLAEPNSIYPFEGRYYLFPAKRAGVIWVCDNVALLLYKYFESTFAAGR